MWISDHTDVIYVIAWSEPSACGLWLRDVAMAASPVAAVFARVAMFVHVFFFFFKFYPPRIMSQRHCCCCTCCCWCCRCSCCSSCY